MQRILSLVLIALITCGCNEVNNNEPRKQELTKMQKPADMDSQYAGIDGMRAFLQCWHKATTAQMQKNSSDFSQQAIQIQQDSRLRDEGGLVAQLESKLGIQLPPSYRDFLALGGAHLQFVDMLKIDEFDYGFVLPSAVERFQKFNPTSAKIWSSGPVVADEQYYVYNKQQDVVHLRSSYVPNTIVVGEMPNGEFFLLNPAEKTRDNEWEAWQLSSKLPGAYRYTSFAGLLGHLYLDVMFEGSNGLLPFYTIEDFSGTCAEKLFRNVH